MMLLSKNYREKLTMICKEDEGYTPVYLEWKDNSRMMANYLMGEMTKRLGKNKESTYKFISKLVEFEIYAEFQERALLLI